MAKDIFHQQVKNALIKIYFIIYNRDNETITQWIK